MLAVYAEQTGRNIPHDGGGCRHSVDTADTFAIGIDFAVQQQVVSRFITTGFELSAYRSRNIFKRSPDTGFVGAAAHKIPRGAVAEDGID